MSVHQRSILSIHVLEVKGSFFGGDETDELSQAITEAGASGNRFLILDMTQCSAMNSSALGVLTRARKEYAARGGVIRMAGIQRRLESILNVTRLIHLFDHHPTVEEAMASFAEARAAG
jgi:anti-sigma B factor antagonist